MSQQFRVGDEGKTRGGLRYRVVGVCNRTSPVQSIINTRGGQKLPYWHRADGRMNVTDDPDYWLVAPGFIARIAAWISRIRRAALTTEAN